MLSVCLFTERLTHLVFKTDSLPQANPTTPSCGNRASCQTDVPRDSLFERVGWFYAFLRVRLFRNDTEAIARALRLAEEPPDASRIPMLVEVGCGPGFYSCRLADGFPGWTVLGVDRSHEQLRRAREAARQSGLSNCEFRWGDAAALERADASVDRVFASRLFTVLEPSQLPTVLAEMHRVLRPGGRCFLAEPRSRWRAAIPLGLLWLLARLPPGRSAQRGDCREPRRPTVLAAEHFRAVVSSQPWENVLCWEDGHYQYALVQKRNGSGPGAECAVGGR